MPNSVKSGRTRRRKERANVRKRIRGVYIRSRELSSKDIRVANISELGLGLDTEGLEHRPAPDSLVEVRLLVGRTATPVQVRVVHVTAELTGIEFQEPSDLIRGAIRAYFEPEIIGASMRPAGHQTRNGAVEHRFSDGGANSISIWVLQETVFAFQIGVLGNSVEWKEGAPVRMIQNGRAEPLGDHLRNQLIKLVQSAEAIDPEIQEEIETILLLNAAPVRQEPKS